VGSVAVLWILKSPVTREGYWRSLREDSGVTEWGCGERGLAYALPTLKRGELVPKQSCGVKTSIAIKSSVSGGKKGRIANLCRNSVDK